MKNKKFFIYKITIISAFESIYEDDKIIDFKEMNKKLKEHDKDLTLKPFMKKILRRQIIKDYTNMNKKVFNPYGDEQGFRDTNKTMFFLSKEEAVKALKSNYGDIWEGGSWGSPTFAVIEKYHQGFCLVDQDSRWFYEATFTEKKHRDQSTYRSLKVKSIKEPVWAKGTINFGG